MPTDPRAEKPTEEALWAGPSGERWLANVNFFESSIRPIGDALLDHARLAPGLHVIDVGCGAGAMALEVADRVAPGGSVTGLDISPGLVGEATRRATARPPKSPARFILGDAARADLPRGKADLLLSRFGIMFFTDPCAAFSHMHTFLKPGAGRLAVACWAPLKDNPWMMEVRTLLAAHFELPTPPPHTPGPFAFDEPDYFRGILTKAGFSAIEITPWKTELPVGGPNSTPDLAADFLLSAMSMAQRATEAPEPLRTQVRNELRDRLRTFLTPTGVRMAASVWLVTARA